MKPTHHYTGHQTFDLTECKLHRVTDESGKVRFVAFYPKTWEAGEKLALGTVSGKTLELRPHLVTEWEEVELKLASE